MPISSIRCRSPRIASAAALAGLALLPLAGGAAHAVSAEGARSATAATAPAGVCPARVSKPTCRRARAPRRLQTHV